MSEWQPIETETAPEEPHVRGLWVFSAQTKKPLYFCADIGYVNDDGVFVCMDGDDVFGWSADDYDWWAPLPLPLPSPLLKGQDDD